MSRFSEFISSSFLIFKKELKSFLITPTLYVCVALFAMLSAYLHFIVGNYLDKNDVNISQTFFHWHPWLYCFFAPAISMRLWSEEYRQRTMELLVTSTLRYSHLLIGKFFAAWALLGMALFLTFPVALTAHWLGDPDTGQILTAYLGSFLLAGALLAISNLCSAFSNNQFIAYILGAVTCSLLLMMGSETTLTLLYQTLPSYREFVDLVSHLSLFTQFRAFQSGMIPLSNILYLTLIIVISLLFAKQTKLLSSK